MKKNMKILLLIVTAALLTTGVAVAINGDWFHFVRNLGGLDESDRRAVDEFILIDLPEYFIASVFLEGSNYTGQLHTVDITISHNRPDDSVNIASGGYSLDLELSGVVEENIAFGSFTGLRNTVPFIAPSQSWTPSSPAGTYDIVFSLNNIVWAVLPEYTIISSAGEGGFIDPDGSIIVLEGDDKTFTATAETGYTFDRFIIDTLPTLFLNDTYTFNDITEDHSINATFSLLTANLGATEYHVSGSNIDKFVYNDDCLFDGDASKSYIPGSPVLTSWPLQRAGSSTVHYYSVRIDIERVGDGYLQTVVEEHVHYGTCGEGVLIYVVEGFDAPADGDWITRLHVSAISMNPPPPP